MESLAVLVLILFLIDILAGPIAIALTWPKLVKAISARSRGLALVLTIIRRLVHGLLIAIGLFIGSWLVNIAETPAKLLGLFSIITSYIALRREYFPDFYILARLLTRLGIKGKEEPRIYSADGTEIIRAKNVRRFGRTSGRDGHGPGGQH
jgi:hypothetical protein